MSQESELSIDAFGGMRPSRSIRGALCGRNSDITPDNSGVEVAAQGRCEQVALARRLPEETTVSLRGIAENP